ncbi:unnamed protein product [Gadus morhua 'NCC']
MDAVKVLFTALAARGYSRSARRTSIRTLREIKPPVVGPRLPFVTTYSPSSLLLTRHVKTNFARLIDNTALLRNHGVIAAYRKNKNLRDILVRAKLRPLSEPRSTRRAEFFLFRPWVRNPHNGDVFRTQRHSGPATKNCVYLIHCLTCEVQYVGAVRKNVVTRSATDAEVTKHAIRWFNLAADRAARRRVPPPSTPPHNE